MSIKVSSWNSLRHPIYTRNKVYTADLQASSPAPFITTFILPSFGPLQESPHYLPFPLFTFLFLYPTLTSAMETLTLTELNTVLKAGFGMKLASLNPSSTT